MFDDFTDDLPPIQIPELIEPDWSETEEQIQEEFKAWADSAVGEFDKWLSVVRAEFGAWMVNKESSYYSSAGVEPPPESEVNLSLDIRPLSEVPATHTVRGQRFSTAREAYDFIDTIGLAGYDDTIIVRFAYGLYGWAINDEH